MIIPDDVISADGQKQIVDYAASKPDPFANLFPGSSDSLTDPLGTRYAAVPSSPTSSADTPPVAPAPAVSPEPTLALPQPSTPAPAPLPAPSDPVTAPLQAPGGALGTALTAVGSKYVWGGAGGRTDFSTNFAGSDCSGFVSWAMKNGAGIDLPAQTSAAYARTTAVDAKDAQPGDVIFFNMGQQDPHQQHIAIYAGNGQMIHDSSVNPNGGVELTPIWQGAEFRRPSGAGAAAAERTVGNVTGKLSQFDDTIKKYAGDLANDPEFLKIVTSGATAESNLDPNSVQKGGGGRGLFQFDVNGGMGTGLSNAQLFDPDYQASKIVPLYAAAYRSAPPGLSGADLAAWVAVKAERPDDRQGVASERYRNAYNSLSPGANSFTSPGGAFPQTSPPQPAQTTSPQDYISSLPDPFAGLGDAVGGAVQSVKDHIASLPNPFGALSSTPPAEGGGYGGPSGPLASPAEAVGTAANAVGSAVAENQANPPLADLASAAGESGANQVRQQVFPSIFDAQHPVNVAADLNSKYQLATDPLNLHIRDRMTPEDQQRFDQVQLAMGGVEMPSPEGGNALAKAQEAVDALRAQFPQMSEGSLAASGAGKALSAAKADAASAARPGYPSYPAPLEAPPVAEQGGDTVLRGLVNMAKARGFDTSDLEAQLPKPTEAPPAETFDSNGAQLTGANPSAPSAEAPTPVSRAGITPETIQAAHERIDKALPGDWYRQQQAHDQLDTMLSQGAAPDEIARFLSGEVEGHKVGATSILRSVRTGSLAGGLSTEGKVALSPFIQTAMRAPTGAIMALARGKPGDLAAGLQGGIAGLAEGALDALQTVRYGTNYRAALTGGATVAQGGYGFAPGLDAMGKNALTRAAGTAALGLVRTHGAIADISAGIGRGAAAATGATPEAAVELGQKFAMRSGQYGTIGNTVAKAFDQLRQANPTLDVVGQILMPFYRVGYNAFTQGVERSPVGLVGTGFDVARGALGKGPYAAGATSKAVTPVGERITNNMLGVGLAAYGFTQAAQGNITADRPQNGDPKHSIRIAGQWIPLRALGPAGEALAQSAILYEAARDGKGDLKKEAELSAGAYVGHVNDDTWVSGIGDIFNEIGDLKDLASNRVTAARSAQRDLGYKGTRLGESFVPQFNLGKEAVGAVQRMTSPTPTSPTLSGPKQAQPASPTLSGPARRYAPRP